MILTEHSKEQIVHVIRHAERNFYNMYTAKPKSTLEAEHKTEKHYSLYYTCNFIEIEYLKWVREMR